MIIPALNTAGVDITLQGPIQGLNSNSIPVWQINVPLVPYWVISIEVIKYMLRYNIINLSHGILYIYYNIIHVKAFCRPDFWLLRTIFTAKCPPWHNIKLTIPQRMLQTPARSASAQCIGQLWPALSPAVIHHCLPQLSVATAAVAVSLLLSEILGCLAKYPEWTQVEISTNKELHLLHSDCIQCIIHQVLI